MSDSALSRRLPCWSWWALALACGLQAFEIRFRGIDPDEFEHLHAAYSVYRGEVPYRDFFEHHGPLLYYALQPAFWLCGPELAVLWLGRLAMWLCSLGTLCLTAAVARRAFDSHTGSVAAALLAWTSIFHTKGIELRPDGPATLLILIATALAVFKGVNRRGWLTVGALFGLATLFTQKSIVPAAGLAAACVYELRFGARRPALTALAAFALGGAAVWGGAIAVFAVQDATRDFLFRTVVQVLTWPVSSQRWEHFRPTLVADLTVWVAASVEIVAALLGRGELSTGRFASASEETRALMQPGSADRPLDRSPAILAGSAAFCIASLVWVKATYPQFYLLWFPLLAILAARRLVVWSQTVPDAHSRRFVRLAGVVLATVQTGLWMRSVRLGPGGALRHLTTWSDRLFGEWPIEMLIVVTGLATAVWFLTARGNWSLLTGVLAGLGMWHAVLRNCDSALWSNQDQVLSVVRVNQVVDAHEKVFGGFTGYAALRPHAYYYWWINDYSLALMSDAERETLLLAKLQESPPAAVLFDGFLESLPPTVLDWLRERYRPDESTPWLWIRRD